MLALFELTPPSIFSRGCIQLPQINKPFNRNLEGFYRYRYELNSPGLYEFWRINLPLSLKSLKYYICPSYCTSALFQRLVINPLTCENQLVSTSKLLIDHLFSVYGASNMMTSATIYLEACQRDIKQEKTVSHQNITYQQANKTEIPTIER